MLTVSEKIYQGFTLPVHVEHSDQRRVGPKLHFLD